MNNSKLILQIYKLPDEIQGLIYEYNVDHRQKMKWVLREVMEQSRCENCDKHIFRYVFSKRNMNMTCCSEVCVDELVGHTTY